MCYTALLPLASQRGKPRAPFECVLSGAAAASRGNQRRHSSVSCHLLPQDDLPPISGMDSSDAGEADPRTTNSVLALARSLSWASRGTRSEAQRQNSMLSCSSEVATTPTAAAASGGEQAPRRASEQGQGQGPAQEQGCRLAVPLGREFVASLRLAAEDEAMGLPGATNQR